MKIHLQHPESNFDHPLCGRFHPKNEIPVTSSPSEVTCGLCKNLHTRGVVRKS